MKKLMVVLAMLALTGCNERVNQGQVGRISTPNGWDRAILKPGSHVCYGRDKMYLIDTTSRTFKETLQILIGGKVNLRVDVSVRCRANVEDEEMMRKAFDSVKVDDRMTITTDQLYNTFLQQKVLSIPKEVYEVQESVSAATSNGPTLVAKCREQIMAIAKTTPLLVESLDMTNYDWPQSITQAQEELVKIQLKAAAAEAQVKADLKKAEGDLEIEKARRNIEMTKAEAIAESIGIIKDKLANSPEYLMWHQVKVMGEAANGPNNTFILYPYNTDMSQVRQMVNTAMLSEQIGTKAKK